MSVKSKATGTPYGMYYIRPHYGRRRLASTLMWLLYVYIDVGLSALLVSTDKAMRRPRYVERVADWLHVSFLYVLNSLP